mmetsp:Transcript_28235/g.63875  ORF Transcript_28235/g.63875 Transcript_28235/m.63875 type:complete len:101 (-) Transcript_28235:544-846(-)
MAQPPKKADCFSCIHHRKTFVTAVFCARHMGQRSRRSAQALQQQTWRHGSRRMSRGASRQTTQARWEERRESPEEPDLHRLHPPTGFSRLPPEISALSRA